MSPNVKWLTRALVDSPYYIGLCVNEAAFAKEMRRLKVPKDARPAFIPGTANACVHFLEKGDGKLLALVTITRPKGISRNQINALLVHEAVHIWQAVRESIGERSPSAEFEAYSIQGISQSLMEAFWEKSK